MNNLDNKTTIPIFALAASVPTFFGFVLWLSSIAFTANSAEKKVAELEKQQRTYNELLVSIKEDLTLVKYKLDIKEK